MSNTTNMFAGRLVIAGTIALAHIAGIDASASEVCVTNASGPDICVNKSGSTPILNFHFSVDYVADASNPSVTLLVGDDEWNVRSDNSGNPGNIGTIDLNVTGSPQDFEVRIANGANAGAVNVGAIDLTDTEGGYSLIRSGSRITGDLGDFTLVKDGSNNGGSANGFTVEGDVIGDVTLADAGGFTIEGDLVGEVDIGEGAGFTIEGTVGPASGTKFFIVDTITSGTLTIGASRNTYITVDDEINAGSFVINGDPGNRQITIGGLVNVSGTSPIVLGATATPPVDFDSPLWIRDDIASGVVEIGTAGGAFTDNGDSQV